MNSSTSASLAIAFVLSCSSCASIVTGSTDSISVNSDPTGAAFHTNTGQVGVTPTEIDVPCEQDIEFTFTHAGYATTTYTSEHYMSKWVWGNILIGGLIGLIIDFGTDNAQTHEAEVMVTLGR